jgi:EmrB/QacA subfamily drug resistance transporter
MVAIFLSAIDQTVVSIALLSIAGDLGSVEIVAWVISGYLVASTVATPIYGKLSDLYGRRRVLNAAIAVSLVGSVLCAFAQSMPQLIAWRILQGIGGGGLLAVSQAVIADIIPGPERGRYQGYFSGVYAVAAVLGPMIGGFLTHYLSWRAVFLMNVPLGIAAYLMTQRTLRRLAVPHTHHRIDYVGAALLSAGLSVLLVALTRVGQGHGWLEPATLAMYAAAIALLAACAAVEMRVPEPILPPSLFGHRAIVLCFAVLALMFFVLVGLTVMMPLAMQALGGVSAREAALRLLPLSVAIPASAWVVGRIMARTHRARPLIVAGAILSALGVIGIAYTPVRSEGWLLAWMTALGIGLGCPLPTAVVIVQLAVPPPLVGVATAATVFFRSLGGAIGSAVLTSVLWSQLHLERSDGRPLQQVLADMAGSAGGLEPAFVVVYQLAAVVALLACVAAFALPPDRLGPRAAPAR